MLTEDNILEIEKLISEVIDNLQKEEADTPSPTYVWDITQEKVKESTKKIKTKEQIKKYLDILFKKIKKLPKRLKIKILKYVFLSFIGIVGYSELYDYASKVEPELNDEISIVKLSLDSDDSTDLNHKDSTETIVKEPQEVKEKIFDHIPNSVSDSLVILMKQEEGSAKHKGEPVLVAYDLGDGMITVGWGHAESKSKSQFKVGDTIDLDKAKELLAEDLQDAQKAVNSVFNQWKKDGISFYVDQNMYDAMVSMAFNMGRGGFRGSDFIQLIKKGKYNEAKERILSTNISYPGHIKRRKRESELFGKSLGSNPLVLQNKKLQEIISEDYKKRLIKLAGII